MKKRPSQNLNLFESNAQPSDTERQEAAIAAFVPQSVAPQVDATACPKCGGRSQATAHPIDHQGCTRYCLVCATPEEPYYFTPEALL